MKRTSPPGLGPNSEGRVGARRRALGGPIARGLPALLSVVLVASGRRYKRSSRRLLHAPVYRQHDQPVSNARAPAKASPARPGAHYAKLVGRGVIRRGGLGRSSCRIGMVGCQTGTNDLMRPPSSIRQAFWKPWSSYDVPQCLWISVGLRTSTAKTIIASSAAVARITEMALTAGYCRSPRPWRVPTYRCAVVGTLGTRDLHRRGQGTGKPRTGYGLPGRDTRRAALVLSSGCRMDRQTLLRH